ncbi:hypothetical protein BRADI_4g20542v3 [Brachypodium distachyon]|uniref:Uncharacterized protein n=1 Tax=Brachypodium distachyon TaxID=15368 RepID=A0A2K2CNZ5_BRADI|nr:hypothetical protein BRADI_4g20542v3 [Brachypodium distachyon]
MAFSRPTAAERAIRMSSGSAPSATFNLFDELLKLQWTPPRRGALRLRAHRPPLRLEDLIPNHATRRLFQFQGWCVARGHADERAPTPTPRRSLHRQREARATRGDSPSPEHLHLSSLKCSLRASVACRCPAWTPCALPPPRPYLLPRLRPNAAMAGAAAPKPPAARRLAACSTSTAVPPRPRSLPSRVLNRPRIAESRQRRSRRRSGRRRLPPTRRSGARRGPRRGAVRSPRPAVQQAARQEEMADKWGTFPPSCQSSPTPISLPHPPQHALRRVS